MVLATPRLLPAVDGQLEGELTEAVDRVAAMVPISAHQSPLLRSFPTAQLPCPLSLGLQSGRRGCTTFFENDLGIHMAQTIIDIMKWGGLAMQAKLRESPALRPIRNKDQVAIIMAAVASSLALLIAAALSADLCAFDSFEVDGNWYCKAVLEFVIKISE
jgi:hypothetical protein